MTDSADFVIVGGGIVGVALALEGRRRHPAARFVVLGTEARCGQHATGRRLPINRCENLVVARTNRLGMDFVVEGDGRGQRTGR